MQAAPWERLDEAGEYRELCRTRLEHAVQVREPLVLISQVQRSGGTLLSQLFDGHPECHVHPYELQIGYPGKAHWPPIDLGAPERWFEILYEKYAATHLVEGYHKFTVPKVDGPAAPLGSREDVFPFVFLPRLQQQLFEQCVAARRVESERDVLDCYFTSYFNAWLDNHNLYQGPKKAVVGFTPWMVVHEENVVRLFDAYPDGLLVSIVRDPRSWYVSARSQHSRYEDVEEALARWRRSAEAILDARGRFGERVVVLTYEELVRETETVMAGLAERLGIAMSPVLLMPTFNCRPIRANSSEAVERYGVLSERASTYRDSLDGETVARIEELAGDLYARTAALARA